LTPSTRAGNVSRVTELSARIRSSYSPEKAWAEMSNDLPVYLVYRPLSFFVTAPLARAGIAPSVVTACSLALALLMPVVSAMGGAWDYAAVAGLAFLVSVADCVDGNLARLRGRAHAVGALFDAAVDAVAASMLVISLGLLVAKRGGQLGPYAVGISLISVCVTLVGRRIRDELASLTSSHARASERPRHLGARQWLVMALSGLEHVYALAIAAGGVLGRLDAVLVGVALYATVVSVVSTALAFRTAARSDSAANGKLE